MSADPFGLNALNAAYRLKLGELSMDLQQGGMSHYAPFIYPLVTVNGAETWGLDYDRRADHLFFTIRYGVYRDAPPEIVIKPSDLPSVISVQHNSRNLAEHLAHQIVLRGILDKLGAHDVCGRDTYVADSGRKIVVASGALWRRSGAMVFFQSEVTRTAPSAEDPRPLPQFLVSYKVVGDGYFTADSAWMLRKDTPCLLARDEITAMSVPLDSAAYQVLRARISAMKK